MKTLRPILILGIVTIILFGGIYPVVMLGVGQLMPEKAAGEPVYHDEQLVGFENIGQPFDSSQYFWGRPSAVAYNAAATGGSNKGPTNPEFLSLVEDQIDSLLKYHPDKEAADIPVELVTASGSGLDPHITPQGAVFQVQRIAQARGMSEEEIRSLIDQYTEDAFLGWFGPSAKVNVLTLNLALDAYTGPK